MKLISWKEGSVEVYVPDPSYYNISSSMPVFFNPRAKVSRDVSVLFLSALKPASILDGMAGTGIRGIRYAVESGIKDVYFNDINPAAVNLIKDNCRLNGVDAVVYNEDINVLTRKHSFLSIDLDPFGSPSPFIHNIAFSIPSKGYVLVTATDTSPLSGHSPLSAVRKYHTLVKKVEWSKEYAVRVLAGYIQHAFMVHEKCVRFLGYYFIENHVRLVGVVLKRPSEVSSCAKNIELYGSTGPIWTGPLKDETVVKEALKYWNETYSKKSRKLLELLRDEIDTVGYYNIHYHASKLRTSAPPVDKIINALIDMGYKASRSSVDPLGVKTDAPLSVVEEVIKRTS